MMFIRIDFNSGLGHCVKEQHSCIKCSLVLCWGMAVLLMLSASLY